MAQTWSGRLAAAWRARFGAPPEHGMDEEMRFHLDMATRRNIERGMSPDEARRRALATFGGVAQQQEAARDEIPGHLFDELRQDLKFAVRTLRRNPGFTTSVVLTLALGIGANTAIFSVVNGVLLRPLPVRDPERLTFIGWDYGTNEPVIAALSLFNLDYLRRNATSFSGLTTYGPAERRLGSGPDAPTLRGMRVGLEFFEALGSTPVIGRGFVAEEQRPGGQHAVVLSDALWKRAFGARRDVVGTQIRLDDSSYTVVGILPPSFRVPGDSPGDTDFIIPLQLAGDPTDRSNDYIAIARLKRDRTHDQALADLAAVSRALAAEYPGPESATSHYRFVKFEDLFVGAALKRILFILLGAVTFVLLISAANAANLLLARAAAREREIVVRTALGAKRGRIVRQLLSEGVVLSSVAGALGLALGMFGVRAILALKPGELPRADEIGLDVRVLAFTAGIVFLTGLVFGLAAAMPAGRLSLSSVLGERASGSVSSQRSRDLLVMSETAFAIVLLAGAGLLLSSFARLRRVDPGFTPENVTAVRFGRMPQGYDRIDAVWQFERQMIERLSSVPGIERVAGLPSFPLERGWNMPVALAGVAESGDGGVEYRWITPEYFETLRIPLVQGRAFTTRDDRHAPRVAMVNAAMAKRFFPAGNALGSRLEIGRYKDHWVSKEFEGTVEIVGVVGDVREIGLNQAPKRTVYVPTPQAQDLVARSPLLIIRANPGTPLRSAVDDAVRNIDPRITMPRLEPMPAIVGASIAEQRFETTVLTMFAGTALVLTALGIFGVVAYGVQQRVREIGVRVALGASSGDLLRLIVGRSLMFVTAGAVIGVAGALALTRFLSGILFGVTASDPLTFALAVGTLLGVAIAASYIPARRATRIDPVRALRLE
jgi:predicted permease